MSNTRFIGVVFTRYWTEYMTSRTTHGAIENAKQYDTVEEAKSDLDSLLYSSKCSGYVSTIEVPA